MGSTIDTGVTPSKYGTDEDIQGVVNALYGKTAAEAQELVQNIGSDGYVMFNGKKYALPLFLEGMFAKYGIAGLASILSHTGGYDTVKLSSVLQSYLQVPSVVASLAYIVDTNNITLDKLNHTAYLKGFLSAKRADPRIWKEAQIAQYGNLQAGGYGGLMNNIAMSGLMDSGDLRNPMKNAPKDLNMKLLMWLVLTGNIGLVMMMLYHHESRMSSAMSWKLMSVLNRQNILKKKIMEKVAGLSKSGDASNPEMATELQSIQTALQELKGQSELVTGILSNLQEQLKNMFELVMSTLRTENQMVLTAARG